MGVTEDNTNLRRSGTLTGELADLLDDLVGGGLEPCGSSAGVGDGGGRNALALAVKSTHLVGLVVVVLVVCRGKLQKSWSTNSHEKVLVGGGNFFAELGQRHWASLWVRVESTSRAA